MTVKEKIIQEMEHGEQGGLWTVNQLAKQLNAGRETVRRALRRLTNENKVERQSRSYCEYEYWWVRDAG